MNVSVVGRRLWLAARRNFESGDVVRRSSFAWCRLVPCGHMETIDNCIASDCAGLQTSTDCTGGAS